MLEGKNVNLRVVEKEELGLFTDLLNDLTVGSEYMPILQQSKGKFEERYDKLSSDERWFFVEKKDGCRIGWISHSVIGGSMTIEYALVPAARNRGACTEAVRIMVDYLFLSQDITRIQAEALTENSASQRVLEKAGFTREGTRRQASFVRGQWQDDVLFSILREDWKAPRLLTKLRPQT